VNSKIYIYQTYFAQPEPAIGVNLREQMF